MRIKKFDPSSMRQNSISFLIGKRHTGKTVLMKNLLYHMPRPDYVLAMAPTEDTMQMFREFLPEACIFDHFSQEKLERCVNLQKQLVAKGKKRSVLIILDDCMYQKGVLKSTAMRHIFFNGRHDNIGLMCAAQYMMDVDVALRTNIDYIFTMAENILTNRQKLHKYYFGQFAKFDEFEKVMRACTQDFKALVLDGFKTNAAAPSDTVFWYRGDVTLPSFRLCKDVFWRLSDSYKISDAKRERQRQLNLAAATSNASQGNHGAMVVQTEDEHGNIVGNSVTTKRA